MFVVNPTGKDLEGSSRCVWEDNIRMNLREIGLDWMHRAQNGYHWRALVNTAMKLRFP
jgi:hypothetical protein